MPRYDYACNNCGNVQEEVHSMKEDPIIICINCGFNPLERKICTDPQIIFKGEGWASKKGRVNRQMAEAQLKAEKKQILDWGHLKQSKCIPNFNGQVTGDPGDPNAWRDAGKLAAENGKDASSFEAKAVECEQNTQIPDHLKTSRLIGGSQSSNSEQAVTESSPIPGGMTITSTPGSNVEV